MYQFLQRMSAGLRSASKTPSASAPGRRTRPAVERLEERLALSLAPNLMGDVFMLQGPTGKAGVLTILMEDRRTGTFMASFLDSTNNHTGGMDFGGGQIGRPHNDRASISFAGQYASNIFHQSVLVGSVKGERHDTAITATLVAIDLIFVQFGQVTEPTVQTPVTGHA